MELTPRQGAVDASKVTESGQAKKRLAVTPYTGCLLQPDPQATVTSPCGWATSPHGRLKKKRPEKMYFRQNHENVYPCSKCSEVQSV